MSFKKYASKPIRGKLKVCRYLKQHAGLKSLVPQTKSFNQTNLQKMSRTFSTLYVKPDIGSQGMGIVKLKTTESGFELKEIIGKKQKRTWLNTLSAVFQRLNKNQSGKMIIQQGIMLDQVNKRPYDVRVMVQRRPGGEWTCTGFLVKIGATNKIVTNYYQGGTICSLKSLHEKLALSADEGKRRKNELASRALQMARFLSKKKVGMREMGIDFAYSKKHRLWVLEVNSNHPQFHPLKNIDPVAYKKMKSFAASYGRYGAK